MFCVNCGKQIPDGQRLCADCAAQQAPQQPAQPEFEVSTPAQESPKKPGGKKIALIVIAAVLVLGIVLAAVNWNSITRFFARTFSEPTDYLTGVETENAAEAAKAIANSYAEVMDTLDTVNSSNASKTEVSLKVNDSILTMLENLLAEEEMTFDLNWVKEINLSLTNNNTDDLYAADLALGINGVELLTLKMIVDMDTLEMYIAIPELNQKYMAIDLSELSGLDPEQIQVAMEQSLELTARLVDILPEPEELEEMILGYVKILLGHLSDVEKANETMEVDGVKQELLKMSLKLSQEDVMDMVLDVLREAKSDKTIKGLLEGMVEYSLQSVPGAEELMPDIVAEYEQTLDEIIAEMEDVKAEATDETVLEMDTYIDGEDDIVGRTVRMEVDGEEAELYYIAVTDGDEFAFKAEASAALITGSGTVDDDACTGEFVLNVFGNDFLTLEVEDLLRHKDGTTSGTLRLIPESTLLSELGMSGTATILAGGNFALELVLSGDDLEMSVLAAGESMLTVGIATTPVDGKVVTIPEETVQIVNENSIMLWVLDLKLDQLVGNMEAAGVPEGIVDVIRQLDDALASIG